MTIQFHEKPEGPQIHDSYSREQALLSMVQEAALT